MSDCPACGASYRTGKTVLLLTRRFGESHDKQRRARVCSACAKSGLTIVARHHLPKEMIERQTSRPVKEALEGAKRQLRTLARAASASEKAARKGGDEHTAMHQMGRSEGLEGALELLKGIVGVS